MVGSKEPNNQAKAKRLGEGSRKASVTGAKRLLNCNLTCSIKQRSAHINCDNMVVIISVNAREHFGVVRSYANFKLSYSSSVVFTLMRNTIKK